MTANDDGFALSMAGDIDTDELNALLTGESEPQGLVPIRYTESGEINRYTRYDVTDDTGEESDDEGPGFEVDVVEGVSSIAVGSDRILFGAPGAIDRLTDDGAVPHSSHCTVGLWAVPVRPPTEIAGFISATVACVSLPRTRYHNRWHEPA